MENYKLRQQLHRVADRIADYFETVETFPVSPEVQPGDILNQLPEKAPEQSESLEKILRDFDEIIMPGITHWQHPRFFGYFPANNSDPSVMAEMLIAALGVNAMSWATSPAATELEEQMMQWLADLMQLPGRWEGVIQSTASESTLVALLTAREQATEGRINQKGFRGDEAFTIYTSRQVHSSVDKAMRIAGLGQEQLRKIPVDDEYAMQPEELERQIQKDRAAGYRPLAVVSVLGTTATTAIDPVGEIGAIARKYHLWHHVDAAYAGAALLLPEYHHWSRMLEQADTLVVNPHKWMGVQFHYSAYFVRDAEALTHTFSIAPSYLQTARDSEVTNYRDWGIPLGRQFRALKMWFVLRYYGAEGVRDMLREHIRLGQQLAEWIRKDPDFELMAPVSLNLVCFRYNPAEKSLPEERIDKLNRKLLDTVNNSGELFITHAELSGRYVLRLVTGQTNVSEEHVIKAWHEIRRTAGKLVDFW